MPCSSSGYDAQLLGGVVADLLPEVQEALSVGGVLAPHRAEQITSTGTKGVRMKALKHMFLGCDYQPTTGHFRLLCTFCEKEYVPRHYEKK